MLQGQADHKPQQFNVIVPHTIGTSADSDGRELPDMHASSTSNSERNNSAPSSFAPSSFALSSFTPSSAPSSLTPLTDPTAESLVQLWSSLTSVQSIRNVTTSSEKLQHAMKCAEIRRWRITGTCMTFGGITTVGYIAIYSLVLTTSGFDTVALVADMFAIFAMHILPIGVLPTDRNGVKVLIIIAVFAFGYHSLLSAFSAWTCFNMFQNTSLDGRPSNEKIIGRCIMYVSAMVRDVTLVSYLLRAFVRFHTRHKLIAAWQCIFMHDTLSIFINTLGVCFAFSTKPQSAAEELNDRVFQAIVVITYVILAVFVSRPGRRELIQGWLASRGGEVGAACAVAAMMSGCDAHAVEHEAAQLFRFIHWSKVSYEALVTNSGVLAGNTEVDRTLYGLTCHAVVGGVDAFVSHSWHDDADDKWRKLSGWCQNFRGSEGTDPRLWLDKYCVDQNNLTTNLRCLPVFLSGCARLLVLWGPTYSRRLWCMVEVYCHYIMHGKADNIIVIPVGGMTMRKIQAQIGAFSMKNIEAFSQRDKDRLLAIMDACVGGDPSPLLRGMLYEALGGRSSEHDSSGSPSDPLNRWQKRPTSSASLLSPIGSS